MTCTSKRPHASELSLARSRRNNVLQHFLRFAEIAWLVFVCSAPLQCAPLVPFAMQPQDTIAGFRTKFARETDPVRKAKILVQLGDAEFRDIQKDTSSDNVQEALAILRQYRDEA